MKKYRLSLVEPVGHDVLAKCIFGWETAQSLVGDGLLTDAIIELVPRFEVGVKKAVVALVPVA
jgi:hypothetical protein